MSEIKGQLLGILLVISIFSVVVLAATGIFQTMTEGVDRKVSEVVDTNVALPTGLTNIAHY